MANLINSYHDCLDDFNSNYTITGNNVLRICQWNIRGMNDLQKFDDILLLLDNIKFSIDVIVVGETWLKTENCPLYKIPNYNSIFSCRGTSSGGLAVYVKNGLNFNVKENVCIDGFHMIHVEIKINGLLCEVVGVYRPPSFDFNKFYDRLERLLSSHSTHPRFIVGDINIPINLAHNNIVRRYESLLASYGYICTNTHATRPISSNILDHCICRNEDVAYLENDTIYSNISDHLIVVSSFKMNSPRECVILTKKIIDRNKLDQLFTQFLHDFVCGEDVNESIVAITTAYNTILNQCTTLRSERVKIKIKHCPWLDYYTWQWIKLKNKYLKKVKRNPNDDHLTEMFKYVTKKADIAKRRCKKNYFKKLFEDTSSAKIWKNLNIVLGKKNQDRNIELENNGNKTCNNLEVCEIFNEYFSSIGENLAKSIPKNNLNPLSTVTPVQRTIFLKPTNEVEVTSLIKELNTKKSCGPDNLPATIIQNNFHVFSKIFAELFNKMLRKGEYPDCLKVARVVPVFKSGDASDPCNYRPISTLSVVNKIFERLLVNRLVNFLNKFNVLYKFQYGFRKGCGTSTAITELVDLLLDKIDNKCIVGGLFIDLKKAFDTLNHNILLNKLECYGIRGLANGIIRSYLSERQQFVAIKEAQSTPRSINVGVPQGSNIGPLLFLLYINDIGNLPLTGIPKLFADDTALFYPNQDVSSVVTSIKGDLQILVKYFDTNLLSLNLSKTKYMVFHSPRKKIPQHISPSLGSVVIEKVSNFKYLGLVLDSTLSWGDHIDYVQKKVSSLCGIMYRVSKFVPRNALMTFYHGCIHSHFQYLNIVWGHACKTKVRKLQVLQNRCLKIIYNLPLLHPTLQLYTNASHNILPIRGLCTLQSCLYVYDVIKNQNMHHNLILPVTNHQHNTRYANNLIRSRTFTNLGQMRISFYGPSVYNILPENLKNINNRLLFKTKLKQHYKLKIIEFLK